MQQFSIWILSLHIKLLTHLVDFIKDIPYFDFRIILLEVKSGFKKTSEYTLKKIILSSNDCQTAIMGPVQQLGTRLKRSEKSLGRKGLL